MPLEGSGILVCFCVHCNSVLGEAEAKPDTPLRRCQKKSSSAEQKAETQPGPWMLCCLLGKQRYPQFQPGSHSGTKLPAAGFQQDSELLQLRDGYKGKLLWVTQRTFQPPCQCFQAKEKHAHPSNSGTSESRGPPTGSPLTS